MADCLGLVAVKKWALTVFRLWSGSNTLQRRLLLLFLMLAASLAANYLVTGLLERSALGEAQNHMETLAKTIEVSLQQLHLQGRNSTEILKDYQSRLQAGGVSEISLLSPNRQIISTTAGQPPKTRGATFLADWFDLADDSDESYSVTIPIIADDSLLGYVHLKMALSNFTDMFQRLMYTRSVLALAIFGLGTLITIPCCLGYCAPCNP